MYIIQTIRKNDPIDFGLNPAEKPTYTFKLVAKVNRKSKLVRLPFIDWIKDDVNKEMRYLWVISETNKNYPDLDITMNPSEILYQEINLNSDRAKTVKNCLYQITPYGQTLLKEEYK